MQRRLNWGSDRGAAAVEFALVFPLLILVLIGIVEFGSVYNTQLQLTNAAREAARSMAIDGNPATATAAAISATTGLGLTAANIAVTPGVCTAATNISVVITYNKPYLTGLFGASIPLEGEASRRCYG